MPALESWDRPTPGRTSNVCYGVGKELMKLGKFGVVFALWAVLGAAMFAAKATGQAPEPKARVVFFLSTDCPMAQRYAPRYVKLFAKYSKLNVDFKAYFPSREYSRQMVAKYMRDNGFEFPFELDLGAVKAKSENVVGVPTIVIYDANDKKVFQGKLDDNTDPTLIKRRYVEQVLDKLLAGQAVAFSQTDFFGCVLMPADPPVSSDKVTYAEHIAPILNKHCMECHRRGEVAPFTLEGYENARRWSPMLSVVAQERRMPPWKAVHGFGEFKHENSLTETEIATIANWDRAGAPKGDLSKAPPTPEFPKAWALGEPDAILTPSQPFVVEPDGSDIYRNFVFKTNYGETRWVRAMAVRPGNPKIAHHVLTFVDNGNRAAQLEAETKDGNLGYPSFGGPRFTPDGTIGGWVPGSLPYELPEGTAFELKPGASIVVQVHYHKTGRQETDLTQIGLYFAKKPVRRLAQVAWLDNPKLQIPPNVDDHKVVTTHVMPEAVTIFSALPRMLLLGKSIRAEAELPDGSKIPLVWVDRWDFNWQITYTFSEPVQLPANTKIRVETVYNNSASNMNNPNDPPKTVGWGESKTDELAQLVLVFAKG